MVGVNFFMHQIGAVALFATLFVAKSVKADVGCVFDFDHDNLGADFDSECVDVKNSWKITEVKQKKILSLESEQNGCLRTKHTLPMNSTTKVGFRFKYEKLKEDDGKIAIKLKPAEGNCPEEECLWEVEKDPKFKVGEWNELEHTFPIKEESQYFIQLQVDKKNGKLKVDSISVPEARTEGGKCYTGSEVKTFDPYEGMSLVAIGNNEMRLVEDNATGNGSDPGTGGDTGGDPGTNSSNNSAECFTMLSKNLMLTTASVLTLNNLLN